MTAGEDEDRGGTTPTPPDADVVRRVRARDPALLDDNRPLDPAEARARLDDPDARVRERAAEVLAGAADPETVKRLRARTADADPDVRAAAMAALVTVGRRELLPEVVRALRSEDPRVVVGAAVVLGRVGDRAAVPNLVEAFQTEDPAVGAAVAWALGRLGDRAVVPWLVAAVEQGFAAAPACEALGRLRDPRGLAPVLAASRAADEGVRAAAARALGRLDGAAARARLGELVADDSGRVRLAAAVASWELGEAPQRIEEALLSDDGDPPPGADGR